ncbi:MAG TPA: hypothetical protein PKD24_14415 [Pyrinomonadaceae bacterium]|nr:hypothetical protein [Pyrinomonadaceae bacterium]HMP66234.1 hypothetical protein [Pyrinomonadaceae bacterium]
MPTENRTRVEFYLPVRSDIAAYQSTLDWLAEELALARGGTTVTTPFAGLYASSGYAELISDSIRILFCDFDLDPGMTQDKSELLDYLETIKTYLMSKLEEEEIWIVFYPIVRVLS